MSRVLAAMRTHADQRGVPLDVTPGELAEAVWLWQQGMPGSAAAGVPGSATPPGPADVASLALPEVPPAVPTEVLPGGGEPPGRATYLAGPDKESVPPDDFGQPYTRDYLPGAPALPQARKLAQTLRPVRYDTRRVRRLDRIDEEATARQIVLTGTRIPVWRATRRRRLDLDLVLDIGGSGPLWQQLALESKSMLESIGAFRTIRYWTLDTDSGGDTGGVPLRVGGLEAGALSVGGPLPASTVCQAPRRPGIVMLSDGTGRAWQDGRMHRQLRRWARFGNVLLVHALPVEMWNRTALQAVPVTFYPADDGYHRGSLVSVDPLELSVLGLGGSRLAAATAIPVIELDVEWLKSWLPLLRGTQAGSVPAYALLIPAAGAKRAGGSQPEPGGSGTADPGTRGPAAALPESAEEEADRHWLEAEQLVRRFMATASADARRLARLLSTVPVNLGVMQKVRQELVPDAKPSAIAEVMLSGLLHWTEPAGELASPGAMAFHWHSDEVRKLLQARPGGTKELNRDRDRVERVLVRSGGPGGADIPVFRTDFPYVGTGGQGRGYFSPDTESLFTEPPVEPPPEPVSRTVRVGIWGSTSSGRTTYLTVVAGIAGWQQRPGHKERWRVRPADQQTRALVSEQVWNLTERREFPPPTMPTMGSKWSLILERQQAEEDERGRFLRWRRAERVVKFSLHLQDRAGQEYHLGSTEAARDYLTGSDVLLYFFDPSYDDPYAEEEHHSLEFFAAIDDYLGLSAARDNALVEGYLPKHIAVCIPKLDDQDVFDEARRASCVDTDDEGNPWVPEDKARFLLDYICQDPNRPGADYVARSLRDRFHPGRISYHALSSIGYWIPEGGEFDPFHVCNAVPVSLAEGEEKPKWRVRGAVRPLHVLDPLIALAERAIRDGVGREGADPAGHEADGQSQDATALDDPRQNQ